MLKQFVIIAFCSLVLSGCMGSNRMLEKQKLASMTTDQKLNYLINQNRRLQADRDFDSFEAHQRTYFPGLYGRSR